MRSLGKWAVVDEESMSTEPNAAILAIGATMIDDLEAVDRFYVNVDLQSCLAVGLHESESTRNWWKQQSAEAFNATQTSCVPIQTALQMWSDWIDSHGGKSVRLMGNGPCADNMWLNSAYKACGMTNPVPFWNDICHRTLNWIGGKWLGVTKEDVSFKGVKHHAGDDAEHEAQHAIMVMRQLKQALTAQNHTETTGATNDMNKPHALTTISKQEFILNNITEMVRAGRVEGLPKLAADLAEVYDHASDLAHIECPTPAIINDVEYAQPVMDGLKTKVDLNQFSEGGAVTQLVENSDIEATLTPLTDVPTAPREATEPTPIVDDIPTAPTAPVADDIPTAPTAPTAPVTDAPDEPVSPAERTHDDWGLPFSDEWHVSTRNTAKPGYFKRKPGTNEEQYAAFIQNCVTEAIAAGTFTGPDNWATVSRLSKYLDPVQATPDAPQVVDAPTLQPQAETVGQAMHTGATVDAPTEPTPAVEAAPVAPVGASASSEIPDMGEMMKAHMEVCKGFGFYNDNGTTKQDPRSMSVLERCGANNIMLLEDDKKVWFVQASRAIIDQLEVIKADPSGEILKTVLDSVTA
ncbi:ribonuclease H-like domain protein [Vibrio phage 141O35-1]|nr:ribonuclease H-like domain protein [Vibrio phage 141O35-1]CAH9015965.1 ribonuclease H-like domain protein [Vibrio phage 141E35-1]